MPTSRKRERDNWCTPKYLCDALGTFDLDPCSNEYSHVRAHHRNVWDGVAGSPTDGLALDVPTDFEVFVNPPYSDTLRWVKKWRDHRTVFLLRWDPSTQWFAYVMARTTAVWFPNHRLAFEPPPGVVASTNQFPHALYFTDVAMYEERREAFAAQAVPGYWFRS